MLFFLVTDFIRGFIDSNFGELVRMYFRDTPIFIKIVIIILYTLLVIYLFPYKKRKTY